MFQQNNNYEAMLEIMSVTEAAGGAEQKFDALYFCIHFICWNMFAATFSDIFVTLSEAGNKKSINKLHFTNSWTKFICLFNFWIFVIKNN